MNIESDHVRGLIVRHRRYTLLVDRHGAALVRDGTVIARVKWWR